MDTSEKRFEYDIEQHLISNGYEQFNGQDAEGNWVHNRQHDVPKCIYMDVLCEFIAKTQPKEWTRYTKYYGVQAVDKLYHRLEKAISNQGLLYVLRNGIEDMGCKLKVCFFIRSEPGHRRTLRGKYPWLHSPVPVFDCQYQHHRHGAVRKRHSCRGVGTQEPVCRAGLYLRDQPI